MCNITTTELLDTWTKAYKVTRSYHDYISRPGGISIMSGEFTGPYSDTKVQYRRIMKSTYEPKGVHKGYKNSTTEEACGFCVFPSLNDAVVYIKRMHYYYKPYELNTAPLHIRRVEVRGEIGIGITTSYMGGLSYSNAQRKDLPTWVAREMRMYGKVKYV